MAGGDDKENQKDTKFSLDKSVFWKRLAEFYASWKSGGKAWKGKDVDSILMVYGEDNEDVLYSRSIAVALSLFGYELVDTALLFTDNMFYILTSTKKARVLDVLGTESDDGAHKLTMIVKSKSDKEKDFATLITAMKASKKGANYGVSAKDFKANGGSFAGRLTKQLESSGLVQEDVTFGLSAVLAIKDETAQSSVKKAAFLASSVLRRYLLKQVEDIVDEEKKIMHSTLADQTEEVFQNPSSVKVPFRPDNVDSCYTPIIMSGGKYDLRPSAESDDEVLHYGTIVCALGARYKNYCANVARTYLINPSPDQKDAYDLLTRAYSAAKDMLKPGKKMLDVYNAALNVVQKRKPDLAEKLTKNVGCGIGLEFREGAHVLSAKNVRVIRAGMVFNLCLGFGDIETTDAEKKKNPKTATYSLMLADTFAVTKDEPETLTHANRAFKEVSYSIGEEDDESEGEEDAEDERVRGIHKGNLREDVDKNTTEANLRENQSALAEKKRELALKKLAEEKIGGSFRSQHKEVEIKAYSSQDAFPERAKMNHIYVDAQAESLLVPIQNQLVPFHIATVKNAFKNEEGGTTYLVISFLMPNESGAQKAPSICNPRQNFVRELTFKSTSSGSLGKAFFDIKELRKRYLNRIKEHEVKETTVVQEDLIISKRQGPIAKLRDVSSRPNLSRKKVMGIVTAHENGIRYTTQDKMKLDIIYKNVKQAFFQPAENSVNVILHFELHNGIIFDPKKASKRTKFVQFLVEVVESSYDLGQRSRNHDEDGLLEEQEERRRRQRANERFHQFVKKVQTALESAPGQPKLEFDMPYRELMFAGVPNKSNVEVMPTVHSLIALEDSPPLCICLEDIEIACFERVQFQLRNFDLTFVFKDFKLEPKRIDAIPMKSLESIKKWVDSCGIVFYEQPANMLWKNIMKTVNKDVQAFYEDGGWNFLKPEDELDEGDEGEESGSAFEPDEEEESEESESDYSDEMSDEESEFDEDSGDEGEDWDDMERSAKRDDRETELRDKEKARDDERKYGSKSKPNTKSKPRPEARPKKKQKR